MSSAKNNIKWGDRSDDESDYSHTETDETNSETVVNIYSETQAETTPERKERNLKRNPSKIYKLCISAVKNIPCKNAGNCNFAHSLSELTCREQCRKGARCDYVQWSHITGTCTNRENDNNYVCTRWHPNETPRSWVVRMYVQTGLVKSVSQALFENVITASSQVKPRQVAPRQSNSRQVPRNAKEPKQSTLSFHIRKTIPCKCITLGVECEYKNRNKYCFFVHSLNEFRKPWDCPDGSECKRHRTCGYAHFEEDIQVSLCSQGDKCPYIKRDEHDQTQYTNAHRVPCYKWHPEESQASFDSRVSILFK